MKQLIGFHEPYYNLHSETSQFQRENVKTTDYGIQSIKFLGPKIWAMASKNIKNCKSLQEFLRDSLKYGKGKLAFAEYVKTTSSIVNEKA